MYPTKRLLAMAATSLLILASCGGGGGELLISYPELPLLRPLHVSQAPIVDLDGTLHVGADGALPDGHLPSTARHGETSVSYGLVRDGMGRAEVIAYLRADAEDKAEQRFPDGLFVRFAAVPPTVRVAEGAPPELVDETVRVVQLLNAALPRDWQLRFSHEPGPAGMFGSPDGEILVEFAAQEDWHHLVRPPAGEEIGVAVPRYTLVSTGDPEKPWRFEIVAGQVWVDHTRTSGQERLGVIAHEIIHTLGRSHADPDRFPETIMVAGGGEGPTSHVLHPLDREALLAVYGRLEPGTKPDSIAEDLGQWLDESTHLRGVLGISDAEVAFGAALRNGLVQPWAFGPTPHINLEDNDRLQGSASWSGRLLGFTPQAEAVAGAAVLSVQLTTLAGELHFTELESWPANVAPGAAGTRTIWLDGDLNYRIVVQGNTFVQTGGDNGTVTGAFFGRLHEGMGGVVERSDLSAGFAGRL